MPMGSNKSIILLDDAVSALRMLCEQFFKLEPKGIALKIFSKIEGNITLLDVNKENHEGKIGQIKTNSDGREIDYVDDDAQKIAELLSEVNGRKIFVLDLGLIKSNNQVRRENMDLATRIGDLLEQKFDKKNLC